MDPVADMLTRIRNGQTAKKQYVTMDSSKLKVAIAKVLKDEGYVENFEVSSDNKPQLKVTLRYHLGKPVISELRRISRPGLRVYARAHEIPKTVAGLGVTVVSTSQGLMSDRVARNKHGGEILFSIS